MNPSMIARIIEEYKELQPFSGSVLIGKQDDPYRQSYGYADRSNERPNQVSTKFGIASGCKMFTAIAICQLVQAGKLSFDSRLSDCVDALFPQFDPNVTVHHLLTHSSGIPDYFDEEVMDDFELLWKAKPMYGITSPGDFLPFFQDKPMKFGPGDRFAYSNAGYILLGLIIEKITGVAFSTYIETNIFQRCGMSDSGYYRMDQLPPDTAFGYIDEAESWRTNIYAVPIKGGPDGGAYTTVEDLHKFWNALFAHKLLNPDMTDVLLTPHIQESEHIHYGYGVWMMIIDDQLFKYFVMGSDPGVSMQSSVYHDGLHAHIIGNTHADTGLLAGKLDEMIMQGI